MPIVTRNGKQYRLEGPNDVPASGKLNGPAPRDLGLVDMPRVVPSIPGAPPPRFSPNLGSWAPTRPEYLAAPGYETYAPTKAYGYSPTGGDWSGGSGGGGGEHNDDDAGNDDGNNDDGGDDGPENPSDPCHGPPSGPYHGGRITGIALVRLRGPNGILGSFFRTHRTNGPERIRRR